MKWFSQKAKEQNPRRPAPKPVDGSASAPPRQTAENLDPIDELALWALSVEKLQKEGHAEEASVLRGILRDTARTNPQDNVLGLTLIGRRMKAGGQDGDAEVVYRFAAEIASELGEASPLYGTAVGNLGVVYDEQGRLAEAEPQYLQSLELFRKTPLGEHNPPYANTLQRLGELYERTGRVAEARRCYQEVATLRRPETELPRQQA